MLGMGGDEGMSYLHVFDVFEGVMLLLVWMASLRMKVEGGWRREEVEVEKYSSPRQQ